MSGVTCGLFFFDFSVLGTWASASRAALLKFTKRGIAASQGDSSAEQAQDTHYPVKTNKYPLKIDGWKM